MIVWSTEEGSWTPILEGTSIAGAFTYAIQTGRYTRLGDVVHISCRVTVSSINVSPIGQMRIVGLPFTTLNVAGLTQPLTIGFAGINLNTGATVPMAFPSPNTTEVRLYQSGSGISPMQSLADGGITATTDIILNGTYLAEGVA